MLGSSTNRQGMFPLAAVAAIVLACLAGPAAANAAEPDPAAWLFDTGAVVEIDFAVPQDSIDALEAEPDEYQPATFTLTADGVTHPPLEIGLRLKGGATFRDFDGKAAFKVKFNEFVKGQKFQGLKKLTLNSMIQDPSMTHEALAYETFRALGVAAPRSGYAFVRVNGVIYGVYANVETLDDVSLPRWFAATQHLYEASYRTDVVPGGAGEFEVDEGDEEDLADLEALIAAANSDTGDWSYGMGATADLEQMARMWAVERYVGHWDGYAGDADPGLDNPNNYYLHSDAAGLFSMLPWGTDQTWGERLEFDEPGGLLFNRCLADGSCRALYVDALKTLRNTVPGLGLGQRATGIAALLAPYQALESEDRRESTAEDIESSLESAAEFIDARPGDLDAWLAGEQVIGKTVRGTATTPVVPYGWTVGAVRVRGATVSSRVNLAGPGRVTQRVLVKVKRHWRSACLSQVQAVGVVSRDVSCRLSAKFRRRLESRSLRLKVWVGFEPATGGLVFERHLLKAPRLSAAAK